MTKNDFILQAMLQMAGNQKYLTFDKDEDGTLFPTLQEECIFIDAEALANEAERRMDKPFDEPQWNQTFSNNDHLMTIANNIDEHLDKLDLIANALELYLNRR